MATSKLPVIDQAVDEVFIAWEACIESANALIKADKRLVKAMDVRAIARAAAAKKSSTKGVARG